MLELWRSKTLPLPTAALFFVLLLGGPAAQANAQTPQDTPAAAPSPAPAPYSLPWQLRPAAVATVIRSDTSFAFFDNAAKHGALTIPTILTGTYKLTDAFAPMLRLALVSNSPGSGAKTASGAPLDSAVAIANPILGGTYLFKLSPELRLSCFLGLSIPIGSGGGDKPNASTKLGRQAAMPARSAMDNAVFAVDDLTIFPGVDLAYVAHGLTVQAELTLFQLTRVRGDTAPAAGASPSNPDSSKTNFTSGLHVGYFFIPELSAGVELRHQRWLSTPKAVKADTTDTLRDNTTVALGVRCHVKLSNSVWLRPGLSYARGIDDPMSKSKYQIVQLDLPLQL